MRDQRHSMLADLRRRSRTRGSSDSWQTRARDGPARFGGSVMKPSRIFRNAMLSGCASLALASPAYAQAVAQANDQQANPQVAPAPNAPAQPADVVQEV